MNFSSLQGLLNFQQSDGSVKTYLNGNTTQSQLLVALVCIIGILFVVKLCKSALFTVFLCVMIGCVCAVYLRLSVPISLGDSAKVIAENRSKIEQISKLSNNVKFDGTSAQIRVGDNEWISTDDIKSFIVVDDNTVSISVAGNDIAICDAEILELLEVFQNSR